MNKRKIVTNLFTWMFQFDFIYKRKIVIFYLEWNFINLFYKFLKIIKKLKIIYKRIFQFDFIYKGIYFCYFYWKQDFTILFK